MKLKSVVLSLSIISALTLIPCNFSNAGTTSNGYDSSLKLVGIDYETYQNMPQNKQTMYKDVKVSNVTSTTKYYKCTEKNNTVNALYGTTDTKDNFNETTMKEISKDQFNFETTANLDSSFIRSLSEDTDSTSTSWVEMTTKLGSINSKEYILSNDVTYIKSNGFLQPINTHIIGLGTNANFSVIANSEYLKRTYTLYSQELGIYKPDQTDYDWNANEKSTSGYAYTFNIVETEISNKAFMALRIKPNVSNTTVVDGFGHYSKYSTSVSPSLSFSSGGASLSISPTKKLSIAPNTHAQLHR